MSKQQVRRETDPHGYGVWSTAEGQRGRVVVHLKPGEAMSDSAFQEEYPPLTIERALLAVSLLRMPFER